MPKLQIWNVRMLIFIQHTLDTAKVKSQKEFLQSIGFADENIGSIRSGRASFTLTHFQACCKKHGANMNWFIGLSDEMMRKPGKTPLQQLKEAVRAVEAGTK